MKGYVYILTNESMPGLVKIGRSKRAAAGRASQMYSGDTGVPLPFDIHFECLFDDCIEAEALIHEQLDQYRINPKREFFKVDADQAVVALLGVRAESLSHVVTIGEFVFDDLIAYCAYKLDMDTFDIVGAFGQIEPDELRPALSRWLSKIEKTKLKVIGGGKP